MTRVLIGLAALCVILASLGGGGALASDAHPDAFTVIVLPDTQNYSQSYPHIFMAQTEWIAAMADELDIRLVLHAGDVVNTGARSEEQWQNAKAALDVLDSAGIPTVIAIGNHDYDDEARTRGAEKFNEYFGIERYEGAAWFGGAFEEGRSENVYALIDVGDIPFLVMALEFGPRKAVVDWANEVIASFPERDVLVVTHAYMYFDDTRMSPGDHWNPKDYGVGGDAADGDDLWHDVFSRHDNVRMILSGHVLESGVGRRIDVGERGNSVHQILANYQMRAQGGEGYLRIMRFYPSEGIVDVKTYSPYLDRYLEDERQQFVLTYDRTNREQVAILGRVSDAASGEEIAGAVISTKGPGKGPDGGYYGIERSGTDGEFALRVTPGAYRLHVTREGYLAQEVDVTAEVAADVAAEVTAEVVADVRADAAADALVGAGVRRVDIALVPLPYARIAVGGIVPQIADWTDRFAGVVDVVVELGPPALAPSARIELARIVEGERHPIRELHRGSEPPDQFLIDTTALEDGTYEIAVEVYGIEGLTAVSTARFGVRNWEVRVDNLLPPVQNTWFGEQSRKQTALESPGWAYSTDLPDAYFGDADRLIRSQQGEAWLVWESPQLHSFEATIYAREPGDVDAVLSIAVSPDGASWTPISFEHTASDTSGAGWHRVEVTGFVPREIGAAFLRLAIAGDEPSGTGIELGQVRLRSYFGE